MSSHSSSSKDRFEVAKLILETLRTVVVVGGVLIALYQLDNSLDERRQARYQTTAEILLRFGDQDIVDAVDAFNSVASMDRSEENYQKTVQRLSPTRQLFVTWAACSAEGICANGPSRELICARLLAYESAFEQMSQRFSKSYSIADRKAFYFGEFQKCEVDFPVTNLGLRVK